MLLENLIIVKESKGLKIPNLSFQNSNNKMEKVYMLSLLKIKVLNILKGYFKVRCTNVIPAKFGFDVKVW